MNDNFGLPSTEKRVVGGGKDVRHVTCKDPPPPPQNEFKATKLFPSSPTISSYNWLQGMGLNEVFSLCHIDCCLLCSVLTIFLKARMLIAWFSENGRGRGWRVDTKCRKGGWRGKERENSYRDSYRLQVI
ncbi:hypothetical protein CDAR_545001 [Caerostris darwini]|uniref:Uncharacterized protein n=1 Tax=Caerostris darwini TaxID=1538125 RepID=A0AAV4PVC1_9ARAC|nr:hypothetical protein CDAR_545001 [Caerostris darwini]